MFENDRWYIASYHGPEIHPVPELLASHCFEFPWSEDVTEETGSEAARNAAILQTFHVDVSEWVLIGAMTLGQRPRAGCAVHESTSARTSHKRAAMIERARKESDPSGTLPQ